jgi:hypothetical protein
MLHETERGPWLASASGKIIDLLNPDPSQFTIEDIATGLSNIARFNGQTNMWYSVAEHSIHVAELLPNGMKILGLLHDASEAYICDVPSPLKWLLGDAYRDVESRLQGAIGEALGLGRALVDLPRVVKQADAVLLYSEKELLQPEGIQWPYADPVLRYPGLARRYTYPEPARVAFMKMYGELTK